MAAHALDEWLVYDGVEPCPYLPLEMARLPLRLPHKPLDPQRLDAALAAGDRRTGGYLYRPECPSCRACQALRVDVGGFRPSRTQQRVHRKGDRAFRLDIVSPEADDAHTNLFNQHRLERGLSSARISTTDYRQFLVATCCQTVELQFHCADKLVAVSIADRGHGALSAVYCYFDPSYSQYSPGTYAILKQLELCRLWNLQYLYLGLYIASNPHMSYKNRFHPHERLIEGKWVRFE